jgi:transcriptional regulator with XRE-family HTH domain
VPARRTRSTLSGFVALVLADAAAEAGLSQAEVGIASGVSQSQVSKYFRGVRVPDVNVLDDLCTALGLEITDVIAQAIRRRESA